MYVCISWNMNVGGDEDNYKVKHKEIIELFKKMLLIYIKESFVLSSPNKMSLVFSQFYFEIKSGAQNVSCPELCSRDIWPKE